jgi:hypothetical protein
MPTRRWWPGGLVERLARRAADTPWQPSAVWRGKDPVPWLLRLMTGRPGRRRTRRARAAIEALWASGPAQQESIWTSIWNLSPDGVTFPFAAADVPRAFVEFLVGRDPAGAHEPPVRLVTGMSFTNARLSARRGGPADRILAAATGSADPRTRADLTDLLSRTDHPALLAVLQNSFVTGLRERVRGGRYSSDGLWTREEPAEPTPLLHIIVANPHLPTASTDEDADQLAVLLALRGRTGEVGVASLLDHAGYDWLPPMVIAACRLALASLPPGGWREELCERAISPGDKQTVALVVKAGYLPADPATVPLFLAATRQWSALEHTDPDLRTLDRYCRRTAFIRKGPGIRTVEALLRTVDGAPPALGAAIRRVVADTVTRGARDHLCDLASDGHRAALRMVVDTGVVPRAKNHLIPFLFLTGQWDRYDAADPDGSRVRSFAGKLGASDRRRNRLRLVAEAAGRPPPCEAYIRPSRETRGGGYRPGGSAYGGTGGYASGISVHGV